MTQQALEQEQPQMREGSQGAALWRGWNSNHFTILLFLLKLHVQKEPSQSSTWQKSSPQSRDIKNFTTTPLEYILQEKGHFNTGNQGSHEIGKQY